MCKRSFALLRMTQQLIFSTPPRLAFIRVISGHVILPLLQLIGSFEEFFDALEEGGGDDAVNCSVITAERAAHH